MQCPLADRVTPGVPKNYVESDIQLFYIPTNQPQDQSSSNTPANNPSEATEDPVDSETREGVTDVREDPRRDPMDDGSTIVGDVTIKVNQGSTSESTVTFVWRVQNPSKFVQPSEIDMESEFRRLFRAPETLQTLGWGSQPREEGFVSKATFTARTVPS